jgi:hypothetical protein
MFKKSCLQFSPAAAQKLRSRARSTRWILALAGCCVLTGCRTLAPLAPVDLSEPGWTRREGQAVWQPGSGGPGIAGDLLVAKNPDGRSLVLFTKSPFPAIAAQLATNAWQVHVTPGDHTYAGRGAPPPRVLWLQLPACLAGATPPSPWCWKTLAGNSWRLENSGTGESLEGYLNP